MKKKKAKPCPFPPRLVVKDIKLRIDFATIHPMPGQSESLEQIEFQYGRKRGVR